jgi:hypothetical protein
VIWGWPWAWGWGVGREICRRRRRVAGRTELGEPVGTLGRRLDAPLSIDWERLDGGRAARRDGKQHGVDELPLPLGVAAPPLSRELPHLLRVHFLVENVQKGCRRQLLQRMPEVNPRCILVEHLESRLRSLHLTLVDGAAVDAALSGDGQGLEPLVTLCHCEQGGVGILGLHGGSRAPGGAAQPFHLFDGHLGLEDPAERAGHVMLLCY